MTTGEEFYVNVPEYPHTEFQGFVMDLVLDSGLAIAQHNLYADLIDDESGVTKSAIDEEAEAAGGRIFVLTERRPGKARGKAQNEIEVLRTQYGDLDTQYTEGLLTRKPGWELPENQTDHVIVRLGKKSTIRAITLINRVSS